ncbi:hypothetical protein C1645_822474 [Glomus cerebriforme]|uniref:Uncharacterized protein n=1 Tax=Glomus cerebriforme TaxID=658196 RepID=A0A397T7R9_9GLOM|nr:hypothetical protein C1645_822474 [Glomus cerebriforme]
MENGELNIDLYNGQPIVYTNISDPVSKYPVNNTLQSSELCINFPIAEITYEGNLLESFLETMDNEENLHKLYGHFFARKTLIGGKLFIKNLDFATSTPSTQLDILKYHLFYVYNLAKLTLDGEELDTYEKLTIWMNNLHQKRMINIISYNNLIPISQLTCNTSLIYDLSERQLGFTNFEERLD